MKHNRRLVWLNLWLLISLLISFITPLTTQATSTVFSNNPPYIIRGHVYTYGTGNGLAGAQVKVEFEVCDDPMSVPRTVVLPATGADGAWEFDERTYELPGGLGCPCPGSPFTITQHLPPSGYLAVAKQTPSNPIPVLGNVIVLNTTGSGVYDNNIFFDRVPYVLTGQVLDDISGISSRSLPPSPGTGLRACESENDKSPHNTPAPLDKKPEGGGIIHPAYRGIDSADYWKLEAGYWLLVA